MRPFYTRHITHGQIQTLTIKPAGYLSHVTEAHADPQIPKSCDVCSPATHVPMESTLSKSQRNMRANQMWARQQAPVRLHPSKPGCAIIVTWYVRLRIEKISGTRQIFAAMILDLVEERARLAAGRDGTAGLQLPTFAVTNTVSQVNFIHIRPSGGTRPALMSAASGDICKRNRRGLLLKK